MTLAGSAVKRLSGVAPDAVSLDALVEAQEPVVFEGLARDWPLAARGREGAAAAIAYLKSFDAGTPVVGYSGPAEIGGRFFYDDGLTGLNFEAQRVPFGEFLDRVTAATGEASPPALYIGSTDVDRYLPGLRAENDLYLDPSQFGGEPPTVSIWLGNRTVASAHYDMSNNLACSLVGRRRFTLFPPEQVANLYPGPLESTSIHSIMTGVTRLIQSFPFAGPEPAMVDRYNDQSRRELEGIRDFVMLHYRLNERDEPFWRRCRELDIPDSLAHRIALFRDGAQAYQASDELFRTDSWVQVMLGQRLEPRAYHHVARLMRPEQLRDALASIKANVAQAVAKLPAHEAFLRGLCPAP